MFNCLIVQSGGPTAVINNSVVGILDEMNKQGNIGQVFGSVAGIQGILRENFVSISHLTKEERKRLRSTPGSALGTCRHKLTEDEAEEIIHIFKKNDIHYFFYIGGNGSMEVLKMIESAAKSLKYNLIAIGIPKSIDNDLLGTDHSPGYGSAAKFLSFSLLDMQMDVSSYPNRNRITILETMGRHTGWLAAAGSLVKNDCSSQTMIYIPEIPFKLDDCLEKVSKVYSENRNSFLVVAEGILDKESKLINESDIEFDNLNRPKLGGVSSYLQRVIEEETNIETRAIAPSIWQRSSMLLASKTDIEEAYEVGRVAWRLARQEYSGVMVGIERISSDMSDYQVKYVPRKLEEIVGREKFVPTSWYDHMNHTMTKEFVNYATPLIQGETFIPMSKGLPNYISVI